MTAYKVSATVIAADSGQLVNRLIYLTSHTVCRTLCGMGAVEATTTNADAAFENLRLELRRGALVLAVLARLGSEHYGYALRKALVEQGMDIDENTLYPLLRRLETQGLLDSTWRETDSRPKRFYRLSAVGEEVLARLLRQWRDLDATIRRINGEAPE